MGSRRIDDAAGALDLFGFTLRTPAPACQVVPSMITASSQDQLPNVGDPLPEVGDPFVEVGDPLANLAHLLPNVDDVLPVPCFRIRRQS
jgi:hypothetical protein